MSSPTNRRRWRWGSLVIFVVFIALTLAMTHPLSLYATTSLESWGDLLLNTWILAWDAHQLPLNPLHLYEANIFFPYPHTLAYSESLVASATLAAPLIWLTDNPVLGYNFVLLLSFVLTGFGTYLLVYRLTGRRYAAFVAGLIFAFCIYRFSLLSKLQLLSTQWMPFTLLYLDQIANRKSQIANSLLFALFLSLQCLASFYYAFQSALTIALYLVWFAVTQRGVIRRDAAINFGLALMLAAIFIAPFIVTYLQVSQELGFERNTWELEEFSAVPADYFIARAGNWLYGKLTAPFAAPGGEGCLFPGVLVIVLGLYGASMSREKARSFYVLLALFALLMSFGPNLQLTRHVASPLPFPLPYQLFYDYFPGFRAMRVPQRFGMLLMFALAVLAGLGIARLEHKFTRWAKDSLGRQCLWSAAAVLIAGLILFEYASVPVRVTNPNTMRKPTPEVYRWLAAQPPTPIIELPMGIDSPELWYQFYSKFHWQRIVNGYSGFWPPTYDDITAIANGFPSSESIGMLRALGVEHIIVHDEYLTPDQRRRIFQNIPAFTADLDEVTAFGRDHVYRLKPRALRWDDLRVTTFFSRLAITGQEYRAFVIARDAGSDTFIASLAKMVQVTAHWTDERGHTVAQTMQMPLPFLVQPGVTVVPISLAAPAAGRYRLRIEPSGSGDLPSRTCLLAQAVASEVEVLDKPPSASVSPSIQLVDFETDRASYAPGETIFLTLRWKALGLTTEDYTVFTHLVDAQGHLWGQKDNPPLQNTFPTSQWLPGEEVPDPYAIVIDPQAPTGEYRIEVGMYRFSDMKRIDVRDLLGSATATIALGPVEIR